MSSVLHHLLFEDNNLSGSLLISFSPFYLFHLPGSLFYSHPATNQVLRTALSLPPECVREQKHTSHLKMTSSFYTAANQMQAHGSLPLWMRSVHKMGRQRCRIKDKSKTKLAKCKNPLQQHFMAVLPWCQTCSSKLMHIYMHTESGASFIQRLSEFINTSCVAGSQRQTQKKKLGLMLPAELPQTACVKEKNSNGINYLRSSCDSRLQKT